MAKSGRSETGLFGTVYHYDKNGKKTGRSEPGIFGGYTNYDAHGKKTGRSEPGIFGGYTNYDVHGKKIGRSEPGIFGGYTHYDAKGNKISSSSPSLFDGYTHYDSPGKKTKSTDPKPLNSYTHHTDSSQGCYVATCVYGSYDCPQVWTLRRFRDNNLARNLAGRAFIRTYYAVSPKIVKLFGNSRWFKNMWRGVLDNMVNRLNKQGIDNSPYEDLQW